MKLQKILKIMAKIYLCLFAIFWLYCMFNIFLSRGFQGIQETLNPFNFANLIVTMIALSPYIILEKIADKLNIKEQKDNKEL